MSGITGYLDWMRCLLDEPQVITRMTGSLAGAATPLVRTWSADHVALGQVMAPPGGQHRAQPELVADLGGCGVAVAFTGVLHEAAALRRELARHGHRLHGDGDEETVLYAYLQWGADAVRRLRGSFAVAVWDERDRELLLARDRLGVQPLYYARTSYGVVFGSRLQCLLAHPEINAELDDMGIAELTAMAPMTTPGTAVLRGIVELQPGTLVRQRRHALTAHRFWRLATAPHVDDVPHTIARVRRLLAESVTRCLGDQTRVAALQAGTLGAAAVAALAADVMRDRGADLATYDLAFRGAPPRGPIPPAPQMDAVDVAEHLKTRHATYLVSGQELLAAHDDLVAVMDLPSPSTVNAALSLLYRRVAPGVSTVLSGEGADETFGGSRWFHDPAGYRWRGFPWHHSYPPLTGLLKPAVRARVQPQRYLDDSYHASLTQTPYLPGDVGLGRRMREVAWLTHTHRLRQVIARQHQLATAAGVAAAMPFIDAGLLEYVWNIPWPVKCLDGTSAGMLRYAVADLLPPQVTWRRPDYWPPALTGEYHQAVWSRAHDLAGSPNAPVLRLIDRSRLRTLLRRHQHRLGDGTPLTHVAYILDLNAWMRMHRVRIH